MFLACFCCIELIRINLAEEGGGGKVILIERGGYKDMDACVMYAISAF